MKNSISLDAIFISVLFVLMVLAMPSHAGQTCEYEGKQYALFERVTFIDPKYYEMQKKYGEDWPSIDPYAVVLRCMPVVDIYQVKAGNFDSNRFPVSKAEWLPSDVSLFSIEKKKMEFAEVVND